MDNFSKRKEVKRLSKKTVTTLFVGSTPFVPVGFDGTVRIRHCSVVEIQTMLREAKEVFSFCGHPGTAQFLGVEFSRAEAKMGPGQVWAGIRPNRRPNPGEELDPTNDKDFVGWVMETLLDDIEVVQ